MIRNAIGSRLIALLILAGVPLGYALPESAPSVSVDVLMRTVTSEIPRPAQIEVRDDRWPPGAETRLHQHPGPVILAILEGELIEQTPSGTTTLRAGQVVWRAARQDHNVKNVSNRAARVLAIHFDPVQ